MDRWEYCFVDMLSHDVHYITTEGLKRQKIKRDNSLDEDSKDDATARLVAHLGLAGWDLVTASGGIRPILYLKRLHAEEKASA
jgi:hypothetical protein